LITLRVRPRLPEEIPEGQGSLGIQIQPFVPPDQTEIVRYGPLQALAMGFSRTVEVVVLMVAGLANLIKALISPNVPAPEGGVGGIIAIGRITAQEAREGWRNLLNLTAFLSINLAIINLLPIPALDGGRILFALAEIISRRRIPPEKEALIHMTGFILLIGLMLIITFMDISNWIAGKPPIPGG
jgi:regulator of sigma E protease